MEAKQFGEFLKTSRSSKKLTIRQLELYSGVSNAYISQMERGLRGIPSPDILLKLSKPLGVTYENLMEKAGYITKEEIFKNAVKEGLVAYDLPEDDDKVTIFVKELLEDPEEVLKNFNKNDVEEIIDILMDGDNNELWNTFANRLLAIKGLDPERTKDIMNELENMSEKELDDVIDFIRYKKSKNDR